MWMMKSDDTDPDELPKLVEKLVDGWTKTYASGTVAVRLFIIVWSASVLSQM
jgi:hypothetical protein